MIKNFMLEKIVFCCLVSLLLIVPVFASHDIVVDEKRVIGNGDNITFIIGEKLHKAADGTSWEEYPISIGDYEKLQIGDKITVDGYNKTTKLFSVRLKEEGCIL